MNLKQENRFNMYVVLRVYLLSKIGVLTNLPFFQDVFDEFQAFIKAISGEFEKQALSRKGVALSKQEIKQNLAIITGDIMRKLYTYALFFKNGLLLSEMQISQSILENLSDRKLIEVAEATYSRVTPILADLTSYGITLDYQTTFRVTIDQFLEVLPLNELSYDDSTASTKNLVDNFKSAERKRKEINALIEIIRLPEPDVYNGYLRASKILNYGVNSFAVKGKIVDSITKTGSKGFIVTFLKSDGVTLETVMVKKSARMGGFNIKTLTEGIYTVKVTKIGYADQVIQITVNKGERCELKVEMVKI
jgi:hypothetical protein